MYVAAFCDHTAKRRGGLVAPRTRSIHRVADAHVIGRNGLGNGARRAAHPSGTAAAVHGHVRDDGTVAMYAGVDGAAHRGKIKLMLSTLNVGVMALLRRNPYRKNQRATSCPAPISAKEP